MNFFDSLFFKASLSLVGSVSLEEMASAHKKGYLIYPSTSLLPMPADQDVWPYYVVVKDSFCVMVGEQNLGTAVP